MYDVLLNVIRELIAPTTAAFALAAIGLNFHFGLTGLLNMGHAGFMLVGMYGYAIVIREGGSLVMGLLVSLLAAGVFAPTATAGGKPGAADKDRKRIIDSCRSWILPDRAAVQ